MELSEQEVMQRFETLGIPPGYRGTRQAACAVALALREPDSLRLVTKRLYPAVARALHDTPAEVERNIRTLLKVLWEQNPQPLRTLAGSPLPCRPTASQFLAFAAAYMQQEKTKTAAR